MEDRYTQDEDEGLTRLVLSDILKWNLSVGLLNIAA